MRQMFFTLIAVLLAACASSPEVKREIVPSEAKPAKVSDDSLEPQELGAGECALFLWTADEPRRFVLFYPAASDAADAVIQAKKVRLTPLSQTGSIFGQFMTDLKFQSPDGARVDVKLVPGESVEGGQRVSSAQMSIIDGQGWETIVPLVGLRACQPE